MSQYSKLNSYMENQDTIDRKNTEEHNSISGGWDFVILTAMNDEQASSYRKQIDYRLEKGALQESTRYIVIPDIDGKRIGSGGAVLNAIKHIREILTDEDCFSDKHILIINSGGDSKRIPQYSSCGKIFAPVARELTKDSSAALFDEIIKSLAFLPSQIPAGILITAGDILLVFDPQKFKLHRCDAAAVSVSENVQTGKNHGVFIPDEAGYVKKFLHKSPIRELRSTGAEDGAGNVHLDTGTVWLSSKLVKEMLNLISTCGIIDYNKFNGFVNDKAMLSVYADFVYPMASDSSLEQYYLEKPENSYSEELKTCRSALWQVLHRYSMKLVDLPSALFIHLGTTAELLRIMTRDIDRYAFLGWKREVITNISTSGRFSVNSSFIDIKTVVGNGAYIEHSSVSNSKIGENSIVSNVILDSAEIPDNTVVHGLKQKDGRFVVRIYGICDDPKKGLDDGGTFLGVPIGEFMSKKKLNISDLWDSKPYSLWNAKLFCASTSFQQSFKYGLNLCSSTAEVCQANARISLKLSYENANAVNFVKG